MNRRDFIRSATGFFAALVYAGPKALGGPRRVSGSIRSFATNMGWADGVPVRSDPGYGWPVYVEEGDIITVTVSSTDAALNVNGEIRAISKVGAVVTTGVATVGWRP